MPAYIFYGTKQENQTVTKYTPTASPGVYVISYFSL